MRCCAMSLREKRRSRIGSRAFPLAGACASYCVRYALVCNPERACNKIYRDGCGLRLETWRGLSRSVHFSLIAKVVSRAVRVACACLRF